MSTCMLIVWTVHLLRLMFDFLMQLTWSQLYIQATALIINHKLFFSELIAYTFMYMSLYYYVITKEKIWNPTVVSSLLAVSCNYWRWQVVLRVCDYALSFYSRKRQSMNNWIYSANIETSKPRETLRPVSLHNGFVFLYEESN